ncbi:hypothetical protein BDV27DRAFT_134504 [Aspergillus caelatus]|uniref:C2H2-type domain-containing protein n=1 Tax=Aspergillus caelatus TaxID=61420 RepID=A0A5N6ZVY5_9EURO|nr:uncharacterized protein BDV27DRAFT_134504 [Aspergillus caelatus]KAE8360430.1 hypothetical protein BDV27DRAFT_134504 [Aspergillus caelatus]
MCLLCDREFSTERALLHHCRETTRHCWCERCVRVFPSLPAKAQHLRQSNAHYICQLCAHRPDFISEDELEDHEIDYHHLCVDCGLYHNSKEQLRLHDVDVHNLCVECDEYYSSKNSLRMHQQKHQPRILECYGRRCNQTFKSISGMLIHLESGYCESSSAEDYIHDVARECYQNQKYIMHTLDGGWLYFCSACDKDFRYLSALWQHCEDSLSCSYLLQGQQCLAKLQRYLYRKLR